MQTETTPSTSHGSFKLPSGDVYQGEIIRVGESNAVLTPQGRGTLLLSSGDLFVGDFVNGKRVQGSVLYSTGSTYEGSFDANELPSGQGTYRWSDGRVYRGYFLKGRPHGPGVYEGFLSTSQETIFSGVSAAGAFSSLAQQDIVARFFIQYEAEFVEAARVFLRTLAADLDALIPAGSSDANSLAPPFIAKHLLAVIPASGIPNDPWVVGGLATDAVTSSSSFVTLRQLRLRIPAIRKLLERLNLISVRCMQTPPSWGVEQLRGFGQVVEIVEAEVSLRLVNVNKSGVTLRLAEATGGDPPAADEATAIATIFNEKKKKK